MEKTQTNTGVVYGIICGAAVIAFTLILYIGGLEWYNSSLSILAYIIPIVIAVLAGIKQRKLQGGYISFKEALKTVFLVFVIATVLSSIFNYVLLNIIDVPFREAVMQEAAIKMEKLMVKMGAPQDTIDKAMDDMNKPENFTIGKTLVGVLFYLIIWFIVALIIAAIIKKKRPEFENQI
jgi:hypothetical protein